MSARLNGSSSVFGTGGLPPGISDTDRVLSVSMWVNPASESALPRGLFWIGDTTGVVNYQLVGLVGTTGLGNRRAFIESHAGAASTISSSTNQFTIGDWQHVLAIFDTDDHYCILDGVVPTVTTGTAAPTSMDRTEIGRIGGSVPTGYADAHIARVAVWDVALSTADGQRLFDGWSVHTIRPANLVAYYPMLDLTGRDAFNVTPLGASDIVAGVDDPVRHYQQRAPQLGPRPMFQRRVLVGEMLTGLET